MKIYISGQITGLPYQEAVKNFEEAQITVHPKGDDFEIVVQHDQTGSAYGVTLSKSAYEQLRLHFVSNCSCDKRSAIEMAGKEIHTQKEIYFTDIFKAIEIATGITLEKIKSKDRHKPLPYIRWVASYHLRQKGLSLTQIGQKINRNHSTVIHNLKAYQNDMIYNKEFKEIAEKINQVYKWSI